MRPFTRSSRCRSFASRPFRPSLEALEGRLVPAAVVLENNLGAVVGQYPVNSPDDLSSALNQALTQAATDGGDTILLPGGDYPLSAGTYQLPANTTLLIPAALTLTGAGAQQTIINGTPSANVFDIEAPVGQVMLAGMTISGGQGGIEDTGTALVLDGVRVTGNSGGANDFGDGGGIALLGSGDNSAPPVTVLIENSTIDNNQTGNVYSRFISVGSGGGLSVSMNEQDNITVVNTTIADNTAVGIPGYAFGGGGIDEATGNLVLQQDTIADNIAVNGWGGGLWDNDMVTMQNTILADNLAPAPNSAPYTTLFLDGQLNSLGNNIDNTNETQNTGTSTLGGPGDQMAEPGLASTLAYNGGQVPSLAFLPGSPALALGAGANAPTLSSPPGSPPPELPNPGTPSPTQPGPSTPSEPVSTEPVSSSPSPSGPPSISSVSSPSSSSESSAPSISAASVLPIIATLGGTTTPSSPSPSGTFATSSAVAAASQTLPPTLAARGAALGRGSEAANEAVPNLVFALLVEEEGAAKDNLLPLSARLRLEPTPGGMGIQAASASRVDATAGNEEAEIVHPTYKKLQLIASGLDGDDSTRIVEYLIEANATAPPSPPAQAEPVSERSVTPCLTSAVLVVLTAGVWLWRSRRRGRRPAHELALSSPRAVS